MNKDHTETELREDSTPLNDSGEKQKEFTHFNTTESAFNFLKSADIFYGADEENGDKWGEKRLNLNDTFAWALAYCLEVPDNDMIYLAELFWRYGWCGVLYYAVLNGDIKKSQFFDNQRFIEFVANEEEIRNIVPGSSARAYHKASYVLGSAACGQQTPSDNGRNPESKGFCNHCGHRSDHINLNCFFHSEFVAAQEKGKEQ